MRQYAAELEFQNKELEQFAYITSHDLQEPLRKICTFTDLVHQNLDDKVILGKYFNKLRESAGRMSELLKDIVDYSRLSYSDKSFGSVDLNQLMNKVADDFEMLVTEKQAEISVEPLPCITGIWGQLHQLFSNLFSNSLKFCYAKPQISVQATQPSVEEINGLEDLDKRRKYVKIEFRDNGIGFEQQYAEKIFVIFQRLNNKQFFSGTGIGLALCKKIVENHHGYISAQGRLNRGAIFNIYLPQT
jgi:light-regulated signal transduction histidine kinase (bacteriophytochrome)